MNLWSSVNITHQIAASDTISSYSKKYFREQSKKYTILVLLSGGSFPALKLMTSKLFGLRLLSSGLSTIQLERFHSHQLFTTVLAENAPQLALQSYFLFQLEIVNAVVLISWFSSIFSILLAIMSVAVFYILNRGQIEVPFTTKLS